MCEENKVQEIYFEYETDNLEKIKEKHRETMLFGKKDELFNNYFFTFVNKILL